MANIKALLHAINQAPLGPRTLAVFDFDGTIIAGYSPLFMLQQQYQRGEASRAVLANTTLQLLLHRAGFVDDQQLMEMGAGLIKDWPEEQFQQLCDEVYHTHLYRRIYPEVRQLIAAHKRRGHRFIIASSSPSQMLRLSAEELGADAVLSSHYVIDQGVFNGAVEMPVCWGFGKRFAVERYAQQTDGDLKHSFFYSDSHEDLPLLEKVGHPVPLNASSSLQETAKDEGWTCYDFTSRRSSLREMFSSLGLYGSVGSSYLLARAVAYLSGGFGDKHRYLASRFYRTLCNLLGVKINLINGQLLNSNRPQVVVFNHQSQIDGLLVTTLLGPQLGAVILPDTSGKPVSTGGYGRAVWPSGSSGGTPESLLAKAGLSVAMALEEQQSNSFHPGPFQARPFELAMAAGVDIVPLVLHNSADVQPKGDPFVHPATVTVEVLPPISTTDWQAAHLETHIAALRGRYISALSAEKNPAPSATS